MLNLAELNHLSRLELVQWYFLKGFSYKEIIMFLSDQHGKDISLRQLHRLLHQQHLHRRHHKDTVNVVLEAIKADIDDLLQILAIAVFIKNLYIMVLRQIEKQLGHV